MFQQVTGKKIPQMPRARRESKLQLFLNFWSVREITAKNCCSSYFCLKNIWKVVKVTGVSFTKALKMYCLASKNIISSCLLSTSPRSTVLTFRQKDKSTSF